MQEIAKAFSDGGIFMYVIILPSVAGLAIMIERIVALYFKYNINAHAFMAQIQKLVMANNIDRAIKLCNAAPNRALPMVIKAGLTRANKDEVEISNAIEETILEIAPKIQKRLVQLQGVANVSALLGLLGTIVGLIQAFSALENAAPDQRSAYLARGISVAMYTTAFGLIVAVPCISAHLFLSATSKKIIEDIDLYSVKLENLLIARLRSGQTGLGPTR